MSHNQPISSEDLQQIRQLDDFDLTMLLNEISDHGIKEGMKLLSVIIEAKKSE